MRACVRACVRACLHVCGSCVRVICGRYFAVYLALCLSTPGFVTAHIVCCYLPVKAN